MIENVLHAAAEKMPHFTIDHWAVVTFLRAQGNQPVILRITKEDLSQCGSEFQAAIMDATLLPAAENINLRLSSFPSKTPYLDIGGSLHYELLDIYPTFAEWAMLGKGMNYSMPFCIRFDVKKWRDHMVLILLTATVNLRVSEKSRVSVMSMIGSKFVRHLSFFLDQPPCDWQVMARGWV
jgi:hypothetical protein